MKTEIEKAILLLIENGYRVERTSMVDVLINLKNDPLSIFIEDMGLTVRSRDCLLLAGIKTVGQLINYSE